MGGGGRVWVTEAEGVLEACMVKCFQHCTFGARACLTGCDSNDEVSILYFHNSEKCPFAVCG